MLSGHIAFVTGAGSGIGRATCRLFADEGATVVAADINYEHASETIEGISGENHICLQIDVRKKHEIEEGINKVKTKYSSPPTIAVNCAGVFWFGPFLDISEDDFCKIMDINVKGVFLSTQIICKELIAAGKEGTIINLASRAVVYCPPLASLYSMSKAAVDAFTKSTAREMNRHKIRINAVLPGVTKTPMLEDAVLNKKFPSQLLNIAAEPSEIAQVILFLASDRASHVSGSSCLVDGGHSYK